MKKYFTFALIALFAIMLFLIAFPQSCHKKLDNLERKSEKSLIIDSIVSAQTKKHNAELDSIIHVKKRTDSIQKINIQILQTKYNALRAIVRGYKVTNVDTLGKVINNVPIEVYEASVNSGNMCDELITDLNESLNRKDSIISMREIQIENNNKEIATKEQALTDLKNLEAVQHKKLKRARKANDVLKVIAILALLANLVH